MFYFVLLQQRPTFLLSFLNGLAYKKNLTPSLLKIRISSRKRLCHNNHFSLCIRGPGGLDSRNKSMQKNRVTLPLKRDLRNCNFQFLKIFVSRKEILILVIYTVILYLKGPGFTYTRTVIDDSKQRYILYCIQII